MFKKILRTLALVAISLVTIWLVAALGLVFWPEPGFAKQPPTATNSTTPNPETSDDGIYWFRMRDGVRLQARQFASDAPLTVLLLHGVLGSSQECRDLCHQLRKETQAEVFALDLRGHGASEGTPGDLTYISQYEDDVADVITTLQARKAGGRILLAGHSMGGGIAMRYAAAHKTPAADGYLLFAPHLGIGSPTMRTEPTEDQPKNSEAPVKLHIPRIIGLMMLNAVKIHALDEKKTLFFNVPPQFPIHAYSFRAMASMAPDDYQTALTADTKPLLVLVGRKDEAFRAEQFPSVVNLHQNGKTVVIGGETHDGILHNSEAVKAVAEWIQSQWRLDFKL